MPTLKTLRVIFSNSTAFIPSTLPPEPSALNPMNASVQPLSIYAFRRINPAYGTGEAFRVRDSGSVERTMSFAADGTLNGDPTTWAAYGDGVTFNLARISDQMTGGLGLMSFATRPKLVFPNAPTDYKDAYIDWDAASRFGTTANATMNVGGNNNLALFSVHSTKGYGGAFVRPGVVTTSASAVIAGFGTLAANILLNTVTAKGNSQADATSSNRLRDSLGRSAAVYGLGEELILDEIEPSPTLGFTSLWFNQRGADVTGGGDSRRFFQSRPHGQAETLSQRLTWGGAGNGASGHNGLGRALIVYQNATALPDDEAWGIGKWMNENFGNQNAVVLPRYFVQGSGQSNINAQFNDNSSGDNTAGTAAMARRFRVKFAAALGVPEERVLFGQANRTAVGGTSMLKRKMPGDPEQLVYWWDEDTDSPGSLMTSLQVVTPPTVTVGGSGYTVGDILTIVGGTLTSGGVTAQLQVTAVNSGAIVTATPIRAGNYSVAPTNPVSVTGGTGTGATFSPNLTGGSLAYLNSLPGVRYKRFITIHAQGEEDSTGSLDSNRINAWANQTVKKLNYDRNFLGQPDSPVIIQPLARYNGGAAQIIRVNLMRRRQATIIGAAKNVFIAADTGHLARGAGQSGAQYPAHLGTMATAASGGFDPTTGTAEDGYQRAAWQNALAAAEGVRVVYGTPLALNHGWRGPEVTAAVKSGSNTIDCTITYPAGCLGTDFSSESGTLGGFRVADATSDKVISSTTRINANTVRLTLSAPVPAGPVFAVYEPNFASGSVEGTNVRLHLVDNNTNLKMPVASSQTLAVEGA